MKLTTEAMNGWINILFKDYLINNLNNPRRIHNELYVFNRYLNRLINESCR